MREGDWKLIHNQPGYPSEGSGTVVKSYLFNIRDDVSEENDLAVKRPEVVKRLTEKYEAWVGEVTAQ